MNDSRGSRGVNASLRRRHQVLCISLLVCLLGPVHAQGTNAGLGASLLSWIEDAYDDYKERQATDRDAKAAEEMRRIQKEAEKRAVRECQDALNFKAMSSCIELRSSRFESEFGRRFPKGEARFKVLTELDRRLAGAEKPTPNAMVDLMKRVSQRCDAIEGLRGANCKLGLEACLKTYRTQPAERTSCLRELDNTIDKSLKIERAAAPKRPLSGTPSEAECKVLDDPGESARLGSDRYAALLARCLPS